MWVNNVLIIYINNNYHPSLVTYFIGSKENTRRQTFKYNFQIIEILIKLLLIEHQDHSNMYNYPQ